MLAQSFLSGTIIIELNVCFETLSHIKRFRMSQSRALN